MNLAVAPRALPPGITPSAGAASKDSENTLSPCPRRARLMRAAIMGLLLVLYFGTPLRTRCTLAYRIWTGRLMLQNHVYNNWNEDGTPSNRKKVAAEMDREEADNRRRDEVQLSAACRRYRVWRIFLGYDWATPAGKACTID